MSHQKSIPRRGSVCALQSPATNQRLVFVQRAKVGHVGYSFACMVHGVYWHTPVLSASALHANLDEKGKSFTCGTVCA
jgi:hypothetical protein